MPSPAVRASCHVLHAKRTAGHTERRCPKRRAAASQSRPPTRRRGHPHPAIPLSIRARLALGCSPPPTADTPPTDPGCMAPGHPAAIDWSPASGLETSCIRAAGGAGASHSGAAARCDESWRAGVARRAIGGRAPCLDSCVPGSRCSRVEVGADRPRRGKRPWGVPPPAVEIRRSLTSQSRPASVSSDGACGCGRPLPGSIASPLLSLREVICRGAGGKHAKNGRRWSWGTVGTWRGSEKSEGREER